MMGILRIWMVSGLLLGLSMPLQAAELDLPRVSKAPAGPTIVYRTCKQVWYCSALTCELRRACRVRCPDRYSCSSLYGAYGPYGGARYWGAYTAAGWGYR
jgi:hypothetical protein